MQVEVALQRGLPGLREGEQVTDDWQEDLANRGRLFRHAVHTTREMEAAVAAWQLDMVPWQQAELTSPDSLMRDAGMLGLLTEEGERCPIRPSGAGEYIEGPKDSLGHPQQVAAQVELSTRTCVTGLEPPPLPPPGSASQTTTDATQAWPWGRDSECLAVGMG
ncbi:hypothetical protein HaLaN_21874 [Haematococcus lacustris]|uniref:Uncharacterized protein n=1 Tax=Haematococcus lacustris TaxID=44745 RepID=A0A699ZSI5_HAELA|nr:hypothetical protein HaLaN_21874 [Haematococcus lacustris]